MRFYRQYQPGPQLSELVECYWVFRTSGDSCEVERLIPGGRVEMIFHFGCPFQLVTHPDSQEGDRGTPVHFMGQRNRVYFGRPGGDADMLGVRFKPGGLAAFTTIPLAELLNRLIPADYVLGNVIKGWEDLLFGLSGDRQRVLLLDRLLSGLLGKLADDRAGLRPVLANIRNYPGETAVQVICEQTGWYYKKLERAFKETVGYTPKQYCRILRFNKAIRQMGHDRDTSLTRVGYACGYYDQSHFIKDFSLYAGTVPGSFPFVDHSLAGYLIRHQPV